jgi:hypothetical protein
MNEEQQQLGIADLSTRLGRSGVNLVDHSRPWPDRMATYFEIGKPGQVTSVVLSDEFVRDLPATKEYQAAADAYASAVAGRMRCGSPNLFYCLSHVAINVVINWPIQAAVLDGMPSAWLLTDVTKETQGTLAKCCLKVDRTFAYSGRTTFDDVRAAINRIRSAIDAQDGDISRSPIAS